MSIDEQRACLERTMAVNRAYRDDGYVPVIHAGVLIEEYITAVVASDVLAKKRVLGLGGLVPNLLRAPRAIPYETILTGLRRVREAFPQTRLHLFGVGGTATLHLAALLGINSLDSSGWRNRAARGIVQLPGRGDRMVANLGSWRGRDPDTAEWEQLAACPCPACQRSGLAGLTASKLEGFCHRATHNLWTLLEEARQIEAHLSGGTYLTWYPSHVVNPIYRPLIDYVARHLEEDESQPAMAITY
jgi:queuine/archaeosine tRNA-ribosyltransferase